MNGFHQIDIADRTPIETILNANRPQASELTFAYLYMWQFDYRFQFTIHEGHLMVVSESACDIPFALCPLPADGRFEPEAFSRALHWLHGCFSGEGKQLVFGRVEESRLPWFNQVPWADFTIERSDRTADYVYEGSALRELAGRKYGSKRNHISQFVRQYPGYEVVAVGPENLGECRRIIDEWCRAHDCTCDSPESCEKYACNKMLDVWDKLDMKGILIRIAGRFEAFTIGERLNADTAVVRYEKGNADFHGIYTVLNRDYLVKDWPDAAFVNREEDMGIEGLQKAKQSYHPCRMTVKYTLFLQY